jgi:hypothetical protein
LFSKRIVVVVVVFEDDLGERAKKKLFSHKKKNFRFSMTTRVRSRLAYPKMHLFLYVSDFPRSHRAWGKENTQI